MAKASKAARSDSKEDAKMVRKGVGQHEAAMHKGKGKTKLKLGKGAGSGR